MDFIADTLLIAGTLSAAIYCIILSRRLSQLNDLEKGVGGAVAVLSAEVQDLTKILTEAQDSARMSNVSMVDLTHRAETASQKLELLLASMHDLPEPQNEDLDQECDILEPVFMRKRAGMKVQS